MPHDKQVISRQQAYWRALRTLPNFHILEGQYKQKDTMMKRSDSSGFVKVIKTEEKGSDVNLASHLLMDGFNDEYEVAIVVTGDSDLVTPIQMVAQNLRKTVCVLNPQLTHGKYAKKKRNIAELASVASFHKPAIPERILRNSLLPNPAKDETGEIHCPKGWR